MYYKNRKAFTMVELIFVIVVIGILSAIAIPKLAATRDDAVITKASTTIASLRSALSTERQKRILRGNFDDLISLGGSTGTDKTLFEYFDNNSSASRILEYPVQSCSSSTDRGCWDWKTNTTYDFRMPHNTNDVTFTLDVDKFRLTCDEDDATTGEDCKILTK
jgi:general secretion pathway protein G